MATTHKRSRVQIDNRWVLEHFEHAVNDSGWRRVICKYCHQKRAAVPARLVDHLLKGAEVGGCTALTAEQRSELRSHHDGYEAAPSSSDEAKSSAVAPEHAGTVS